MNKQIQAKKKFAVGDVVLLNSGSPDLTVTEVFNDQVRVEWLSADQVLCMSAPSACFKKAYK